MEPLSTSAAPPATTTPSKARLNVNNKIVEETREPSFIVGDFYSLNPQLKINPLEHKQISLHAKYTVEDSNYLALVLKSSSDLLLVFSPSISNLSNNTHTTKTKCKIKHIPWFEDSDYEITAISFDAEGLLYIGTCSGMLYELNAMDLLDGNKEVDLMQTFHLDDLKILDILIWFRENIKIVLINGADGKFVFVPSNALPVLVTFIAPIINIDLYVNSTGLSCALVCLQNSQNATIILDDLDVPSQEESSVKKSIFRRAKENIISRFGETTDKGTIFHKKQIRDSSGSAPSSDQPVTLNDKVILTASSDEATKSSRIPNLSIVSKTQTLSNVKFSSLDDPNAQGLLKKIIGKNQFFRHLENKLDIYESDFRRISSVPIPETISRLFIMDKVYYGIDDSNKIIRICLIHNAVMKEFAAIPFSSEILAVEPIVDLDVPATSALIVAKDGVYFLYLRKSAIDVCVELLLKDITGGIFEVVCNAFGVTKPAVYTLAGDQSSLEGKFAKTIIYYKLAGISYAKIVAKFGSSRMISAMLCFHELIDNDKTKFVGDVREKYIMSDIILQARVEQYLRHGAKVELVRNTKSLMELILRNNVYYSSKLAAVCLTFPDLLWAAKILADVRYAYSEVLMGLYINRDYFENLAKDKLFWHFVTSDWQTICTASPAIFLWVRGIVVSTIHTINTTTLHRLALCLMPWRRELLRKYFVDSNDLTEIIDFTVSPETKKIISEDYLDFFIHVLLEIINRRSRVGLKFPTLRYKAHNFGKYSRKESSQHSPLAFLSHSKAITFSASSVHCVCIRNGKLYSWGDSKGGRLGLTEDRDHKPHGAVEVPTAVNLHTSLRIVVESVSCGQCHNLALTTCGTVFTWGSNKFGQLGIGPRCSWTARPVFPNIPNVLFNCIAAGSYHCVAVDNDNKVWTWGWGVHGQLANGRIDSIFYPSMILVEEPIIMAAAGHSHTALLTASGRVLISGCNHFGQLGLGYPNVKQKIPQYVTELPAGTIIRHVDCGTCSTAFISTKNKIFYTGINPSSIRTMLSPKRRNMIKSGGSSDSEEKDYLAPVVIESSHLSGDVIKISMATTHFVVMTTLGLVYSWGLGKSGQLMRADDDCTTLELVEPSERPITASNVLCAGECSWIVERDTGKIYGCGFNSSGQLGKLETGNDSTVMTIKTKKRVLKVRQPANVHFRAKEIIGVPRRSSISEGDYFKNPAIEIAPPTTVASEALLQWVLETFHRKYHDQQIVSLCEQYEKYDAAALIETLNENLEEALRLKLAKNNENSAIEEYMDKKDGAGGGNCFDQAYRFMSILVLHWMNRNYSGATLEIIVEPYRAKPKLNYFISRAVRDIISESDTRAKWIAENLSPGFIINCIKDSKNSVISDLPEYNSLGTHSTSKTTEPEKVNNLALGNEFSSGLRFVDGKGININ